jgi:hypothetical protein
MNLGGDKNEMKRNLFASLFLVAAASTCSAQGSTATDDNWHVSLSPYLWFTGVHGIAGVDQRTVSVHASPADLLSKFRFGLMGTTEVSRKRFVATIDMVWARLGDDKALPPTALVATSADFKASEFILTPKIGYRLINQKKIKIDALTGFRYWHLGQTLEFNPSRLGLNFNASQNWVDPLVGGRIELPLSSKLAVSIFGDVGGWGAGSQLDYQIGGILSYKWKPKWALQAGWRYLDVDYRGTSIYDAAMSGVLIGVTYGLK